MHYDLLIVSPYNPENIFTGIKHLWLPSGRLTGPKIINSKYEFDYLIFSALETLGDEEVLIDQGIIVTNFYFQTSNEALFCIGPLSGSELEIKKQFLKIKEFLTGPI
ncbi:MAG: hypothetical protein ACOX43_07785 [Bacilli bacterium]|jgi:hypothetical protein